MKKGELMGNDYNEDNLVEQATIDILKALDWNIERAWGNETFGDDGLLGRHSKKEVVLKKFLIPQLKKLNPNLPQKAYEEAYQQIAKETTDSRLGHINHQQYKLLKKGANVSFVNDKGVLEKKTLKIFDFNHAKNNHFLAVQQLEVESQLYKRRPDVVCFVNGIPLVFIELKAHHRDLKHAYDDNLKDYKDAIPHLFYNNAFVILSNGVDSSDESGTKVGTITSPYKFFHEWKRIEENTEGVVSLETTLRGTCDKEKLLDIFENFLLFDDSQEEIVKIMAKNHQYLGVNKTLENVKNLSELQGKLGVFWHTQGSGKSYSMVFLSQKIHRKFEGSFTVLIVLDRSELETQIVDTFKAVGAIKKESKCVAKSRKNLRKLLKENHKYIFTIIHKFSIDPKKEKEYPLLSERKDIIVISDEAHRTQGGDFARNMRYKAIPNASYLGFTGTPIIKTEVEVTKNIFGEYVSIYDFKSAIVDGATLPLMYVNKGEKLKLENPKLNDEMAEILENETLDSDQEEKLKRLFSRNYPVLTAPKRLRAIAKDLVWHFNERGYQGKAMLVVLDKPTAVKMYDYIMEYWVEHLVEFKNKIKKAKNVEEEQTLKRRYKAIKETEVCVVVSSEQNEVDKFRKLGLEIKPHREKMANRDLEKEFKDEKNPFRLAIVCAMWITGFDAPCVSTVYLDKPIKGHTLMQTIARANRVYDDEKENGLIVDYGNVYEQLQEAYATYGEGGGSGRGEKPTLTSEELAKELEESIGMIRLYLERLKFDIFLVINGTALERLKHISDAMELITVNPESRAKFNLLASEMFKKYQALFPEPQAQPFVRQYDAIKAIYNGLNKKVKGADISEVILKLQNSVDTAIFVKEDEKKEEVVIDMSKLDFDALSKLFAKNPKKNQMVFDLQRAIEQQLKKMLKQNATRVDFYEKYQKIIEAYNRAKDYEATQKVFDELIVFASELSEEEKRYVKEGFENEESLALYDLLYKDALTKKEQDEVKRVAKDLLATLKAEKLKVQRWRESVQVKAQVKTIIEDKLLYLPMESYPDEELVVRSDEVYRHFYTNYYGGGESVYGSVA